MKRHHLLSPLLLLSTLVAQDTTYLCDGRTIPAEYQEFLRRQNAGLKARGPREVG